MARRMWTLHTICLVIPSGDLTEAVIFVAAAFIIKGLSTFGEMCFLGVSMYFIASFMKWKNVGCLIHQMRFIYLHSTLYTFPELTETWKYLHQGITELQFPLNEENLLCSCGYLVLQLALIGVWMTIGTR